MAGERLSISLCDHGQGLYGREYPRVRADQALLSALQLSDGVSAASHDGMLRDRNPRMDVRLDYPGYYHAAHQSVTLTIPCVTAPTPACIAG